MALDLSALTPEQQISAIFVGYFERAPDPAGFNFWVNNLNSGEVTLDEVAVLFTNEDITQEIHPFFADPTPEAAEAFITTLYLNLFNIAEPDAEGLQFWSDYLVDVVEGTAPLLPDGSTPNVGTIILDIIGGATGEGRDTVLNKINVGVTWVEAAEESGIITEDDYANNASVVSSAESILVNVTDEQSSVDEAEDDIEAIFPPAGTPGEVRAFTSGTDNLTGTDGDDDFEGFLAQNELVGGVSNSLSSADRADGGAGNDRLEAQITNEFVGLGGVTGIGATDIQPRLKNIEEIDIEARDGDFTLGGLVQIPGAITLDAKDIVDHEEIGSYYSDGDLYIENLTTLTSSGNARNTSDITVSMDHTDNFNSDDNASDLLVLFDNDYLLSGEVTESIIQLRIVNTLELARNDDPLNSFKSVTFSVDGVEVTVDIEGAATYEEVRNAINDELDAQGITDVVAELDEERTAIFTDDIEEFDQGDLAGNYLPVNIVSTNQPLAVGPIELVSDVEDFNGLNTWVDGGEVTTEDPISIDIDLHKAGRGGEGGDLIIGGKAQAVNEGIAGGIEVFNIDVLGIGGDGAAAKPSNVGTISSTLDSLRVVNIETAAEFRSGDSFASLVVRNGFNDNLDEINADGFLGNLTLGDGDPIDNGSNDDGVITNAKTVSATGPGDITINAVINEANAAFDYDTGTGDDEVNIDLDGDAVDYAGSELDLATGDGDDEVNLQLVFANAGDGADGENNQLNQSILDNIDVDLGADDDTMTLEGVGNVNIEAGSGDDTIYTDGAAQTVTRTEIITNNNGTPQNTGDDFTTTITTTTSAQNAIWALNVDAARAEVQGGFPSTTPPEDLPGEQLSLAYIGGATITVTLSGAGVDGDFAAGGGVMANGAPGAVVGDDGFESEAVTIDNLINGNDHFGTQADINAAILEAINEDEVLSKLLEASIGANNTLVVESLTSGDFEDIDLRVDIEQADYDDDDDWDDVQAEAREIFQDSDIDISSLVDANTNTPAADLSGSAEADVWYDGLSVLGDVENSMAASVDGDELSNLHTAGTASISETDNVIDGGSGDDVIVLSTDASAAADPNFTVSSMNALIGGSSNETIKVTGQSIGDDIIMNFRDGDVTALGTFDVVVFNVNDGLVVDPDANSSGLTQPDPGAGDISVVIITGISESGDPIEVELTDGLTNTEVADAIALAVNENADAIVTASVVEDTGGALDQIVFVADDAGTTLTVAFTIQDRDTDADPAGVNVGDPFASSTAGTFVTVDDIEISDSGIDFLDFQSYLISEYDVSTGSPDSDDSNQVIPVTLDNNTDSAAPSDDIEANEVVIVTYTDDPDDEDSFDSLDAEDIEGLFDGDDFDDDALDADDFDVIDTQDDDEVVGGNGKAILMVENAANDGEYKVFELTWDASEEDGDEGVSAVLLGSMDFGDSLEDLAEVNLVGSEDHAALLASGFDFGTP